jgi:hypothetical protein
MFQQYAPDGVSSLKTAQLEDALEAEGYGDDRLEEIELVAVLMEAEFSAGLIAIDVAGIWPETRESSADCAADGEVDERAGHGRPHFSGGRWTSVDEDRLARTPSPAKGVRSAAV